MINLLLNYYLFGLEFSLIFVIVNLAFAFYLHNHIKQRYYTIKQTPDGKNLHDEYPGFKRTDQCPSFFRISFGLISFVYLKYLGYFITAFICWICIKIVFLLSRETKSNFHQSKSFVIAMNIYKVCNYSLTIIGGALPIWEYRENKVKEVYKKYLGSEFDYFKEIKSNKYACVISNHIGWLDVFFISSFTAGSFAAKKSVANLLFIGPVCDAMNCVWIDRADKGANKDALCGINTRQDDIMNNKCQNKLVLFPEGTGSNNSGLLNFKIGAFYKLNPVKPYVILTRGIGGGPVYDEFGISSGIMNQLIHVTLTFCYLYFIDWRVVDLPVITPNDFMFKTFSNLGENKHEVYMEVSRSIISEVTGLPKYDNQNFESKLSYLSTLNGVKVTNT